MFFMFYSFALAGGFAAVSYFDATFTNFLLGSFSGSVLPLIHILYNWKDVDHAASL